MTTLRLEPILLLYLLPLGLIVWGIHSCAEGKMKRLRYYLQNVLCWLGLHDFHWVGYQDSIGQNCDLYHCPHCGELKDV